MQIGDCVRKKSGKPFQNKEKTAIIESFTTMEIPLANKQEGIKIVDAVFLEGCIGKVRKDTLEVVWFWAWIGFDWGLCTLYR